MEVRSPLAPGADARASDGAGHGLAGMRERVRIYGGSFAAGPRGGEFVVSAALPTTEVDP